MDDIEIISDESLELFKKLTWNGKNNTLVRIEKHFTVEEMKQKLRSNFKMHLEKAKIMEKEELLHKSSQIKRGKKLKGRYD